MSQYGVYRSEFEQNIGPYEVCIFVNMGPFGKLTALNLLKPILRMKMLKCQKLKNMQCLKSEVNWFLKDKRMFLFHAQPAM